ncbi:hypothetical protein GYA19_01965 [Candidatus Beckwithbacteria bacterium]|nr:hypothetical protein [Candidatus Beckwithbacteria bacterium]
MLNSLFFFIQIIIIFFLSRLLTQNLFNFFFILTKSRQWSINLLAVLLLPGTIVHELSHWFVAELFGVATGEINLMPRDEGSGIKMGSVKIAKADIFRRTFIGLAPFFMGMILITLASHFLPNNLSMIANLSLQQILFSLIALLVIFLISNTMFSSAKDMEVAFVPFAITVVILLAFYYFDIQLTSKITEPINNLLTKVNYAFLVTIIIDALFFLIVKVSLHFSSKMLKRTIVYN